MRTPEHDPRVVKAPVTNHSDAELILLESLGGREPPFVERDDDRPGRYCVPRSMPSCS